MAAPHKYIVGNNGQNYDDDGVAGDVRLHGGTGLPGFDSGNVIMCGGAPPKDGGHKGEVGVANAYTGFTALLIADNLTANSAFSFPDGGGTIGVRVGVPASASATGVVGKWAADTSFFYVCVAPDTWVRAALATW